MAKTVAAAACATMVLGANADYEWRGATGEWSTSALNWWNGSSLVGWMAGRNATLPLASAGIETDISVAAGGVTVGTYLQQVGSVYTLSGGSLFATTLSLDGNSDGTSPASLTINNAVSAGEFSFKGMLTIANGGSLTAGTYSPAATVAGGLDTAKVTVLAGGVLEVTNFADAVGSKYSTLYIDGGTVKHAKAGACKKFTTSHIKVGPNGMHVGEAKAGQDSYMPYPVECGGETDGGLWVDSHTGYYLLYGNNSYKGGLHLMPCDGLVGIQADSNLGAAASTPVNGIIYEGDGTTRTGPVIVAHSTGAVTLESNRDILIGDNVMARFATYNIDTSRLVLRGAIDCVNRTNGVLKIVRYKTKAGIVVLDTAGGRTNHLGRLIVTQPFVIGNGTTLLENTTKLSIGTATQETNGTKDGAIMNVRDSGHLMVTGGVLKAMGSRNLCISATMTVSGGGVVDLAGTGREVLHGYDGPAVTTVRDGGKLAIHIIRMAGDNASYYGNAANSVMNVDTGGLLRVTGKVYITDSAKRGTLNLNGGMLDWAGSMYLSGTGTYQTPSKVGLAVNVKEGGMIVSNTATFYVDQPVMSGAAQDGGITKWGSGEMALANPTNTFNGAIRVMQGDFATFGSLTNSINTNCTVCVNENSRFRANTSYHKFARIEGSGWFIENTDRNLTVWQAIAPGMGANKLGTLGILGGPINIEDGVTLEIDLDETGNSDCFNYPGELNLSRMTLRVNDLTKLNKQKKYVIAKGLTGVTGNFSSSNLPDGWEVRYDQSQHKLILYSLRGMVIGFR